MKAEFGAILPKVSHSSESIVNAEQYQKTEETETLLVVKSSSCS